MIGLTGIAVATVGFRYVARSFLTARVVCVAAALSVMPMPAAAQSPPKPWSFCSFAGQSSSHGATPVFRTPLDPGWREDFEKVTLDLRTSTVFCGSYASPDEAAAARQKDLDFYNSARFFGPRSVFAVEPPSAGSPPPGGGEGAGKGQIGSAPAPAADLADLSKQARERVAKVASSPEMIARNEKLARRRAQARSGGAAAKPAPARPAVAATPAGAKPGATLYWMCHYWNHAAKTSYYSAISSVPQDKSVTVVQESLNYRRGWVAHLQKMGLSPGAGGNCTGMHLEKDTVGAMASSKAHWVANQKARIVDTGWLPAAAK